MIDLSIFPAWARPAMARLLSEAAPAQTRTTAPGADPSLAVMLGLTGREAEVARRILDGMRNKDIAEALYLSLRSVEATVTQLFRKTGTRSRAALVAALLNSANGTREVASSNGDGSRTVLEA